MNESPKVWEIGVIKAVSPYGIRLEENSVDWYNYGKQFDPEKKFNRDAIGKRVKLGIVFRTGNKAYFEEWVETNEESKVTVSDTTQAAVLENKSNQKEEYWNKKDKKIGRMSALNTAVSIVKLHFEQGGEVHDPEDFQIPKMLEVIKKTADQIIEWVNK